MNFHDRLRIPIPMHDLLREIQAKEETPADTVQDLINKFPLEQADILNHYFPLQPLQVERFALQSIFRQLLENHKELLQEKQAVVWLYSMVGAVSVLFNFILLVVMGSSKYKSSTALFLLFLALTDFITAATLLIELFYISMGRLPLYQANQHFRRQLINFGRHLLQFIGIHLLTLVAIDRWVVFNTSRGRLFKEYRVLKLLLSLCIPLMAAAVVTYQFSPTVELKQGERSVRIYTCVQMGCRGSRMVLHHWRSSNDQRASTSSVAMSTARPSNATSKRLTLFTIKALDYPWGYNARPQWRVCSLRIMNPLSKTDGTNCPFSTESKFYHTQKTQSTNIILEPSFMDMCVISPSVAPTFSVRFQSLLAEAGIGRGEVRFNPLPSIPSWRIQRLRVIFDLASGTERDTPKEVFDQMLAEVIPDRPDSEHLFTNESTDDKAIGAGSFCPGEPMPWP